MPTNALYPLLAVVLAPMVVLGGYNLVTRFDAVVDDAHSAKEELTVRSERDRARQLQAEALKRELEETEQQVKEGSTRLQTLAASDQDLVARLRAANDVIGQMRTDLGQMGESLDSLRSDGPSKIPEGEDHEAKAKGAPSPSRSSLADAASAQGWTVVRHVDRDALLVSSDALFGSDHLTLRPGGQDELRALAKLLAARDWTGSVRVSAYTDSTPPDPRFSSNWALSATQAAAVVEQLAAAGTPTQALSAVGFGASRPIAADETLDGGAGNRRIEIDLVRAPTLAEAQ